MRHQPHTSDLLEIARSTIKHELLPALEGEQVYQALMVMNALGIVGRQISGDDACASKSALLGQLLGKPAEDSRTANTELSQKIRAGEFDAGSKREQLLAHLWATTLDQVRESNPKYLKSLGLS